VTPLNLVMLFLIYNNSTASITMTGYGRKTLF